MLAQQPGIIRAFTTDTEAEPDHVILAVAIRDKATFELRIPKSRYDGMALLELIEKQAASEGRVP